jgi:hypothetical protein
MTVKTEELVTANIIFYYERNRNFIRKALYWLGVRDSKLEKLKEEYYTSKIKDLSHQLDLTTTLAHNATVAQQRLTLLEKLSHGKS